jgi:hypothetical protein
MRSPSQDRRPWFLTRIVLGIDWDSRDVQDAGDIDTGGVLGKSRLCEVMQK